MTETRTRKLRIGTRKSELARWQARKVAGELQKRGHRTKLVYITSAGDQDQDTPLYEIGGKGVFTKALDEALLSGDIDMAVHSYKDLPTDQPLPIEVVAVLEREDPRDVLVAPRGTDFMHSEGGDAVIATGSTRRRAQWLARFPSHTITNIRGNVNTRLRKLSESNWQGAIFAAAGLKRINLDQHISQYLDWMIPAPAQGALAVVIQSEDRDIRPKLQPLNHPETKICTAVERDLLHDLEAGCSAPVGAYAVRKKNMLCLSAIALKPDGSKICTYRDKIPWSATSDIGHRAAEHLLNQGADSIINDLK